MAIKVDLNNYNYAADELKKTPDYYSDAISNIETVLRNLDYKVLAYVKSDLIDIKNSLNTMSSFALELQEDLISTKAKYIQAEEKAKNVGSTIISIASTLGGAAIGATTGGAIGAAIGGAAGNAIGTSLGESTKAASSIGAAFEKAGEAIVNTAATVGNYVTSAASKIAGFFSDVGDFLWTGVKKVGASVANTAIGLVQGLDEFVEAIGDTCAIIGAAAASIFTGAYDLGQWIGGKISGNENWNSATKAMWNSTMDYVAVTHAKNAYKDFYENNPIGQWLDANAFGWFKSTGAAYQVASGLGYVTGVILLTIATFGIGGAAVGGAAATGAATTAAATISVTAGQTALIAGTAGFGRGAETAWSQGATLGEGLTYATLNAGWEGLQFYVGSKIGAPGGYGDQVANRILGQSVSTGTRALVTSGTRVTLDALDGGVEGFVQPLLQVTYADGYYDESGNFINFTENDDLFTRASALFDDMGGWSNVAIQTAIGGGGSLIGEAGDLRRFLKASSTSSAPDLTTPTLTALGIKSLVEDTNIDTDVDGKNILPEIKPSDVLGDGSNSTKNIEQPNVQDVDNIPKNLDNDFEDTFEFDWNKEPGGEQVQELKWLFDDTDADTNTAQVDNIVELDNNPKGILAASEEEIESIYLDKMLAMDDSDPGYYDNVQLLDQQKNKVLDLKSKLKDSELDSAVIKNIDLLDESQRIQVEASSKEIYERAIKEEPAVSAMMKSLEGADARLAGYDKRFKTLDSIKDKLARELYKSGNISDINDSLRYTLILEESSYTETVIKKLAQLKQKGYEIKYLNNHWGANGLPTYQGLNITLLTPEKNMVELQFHTQSSFDVKQNLNHDFYEICRNKNTSKEIKDLCNDIQKINQEIYVKDVGFDVTNEYTLTKMMDDYIKENVLPLNVKNYMTDDGYADFIMDNQDNFKAWKTAIEENESLNSAIEFYKSENYYAPASYMIVNSYERGTLFDDATQTVSILATQSSEADVYSYEQWEKNVGCSIEEYKLKIKEASETLSKGIQKCHLSEDSRLIRGVNYNTLQNKFGITQDDGIESVIRKIREKGNIWHEEGFSSACPKVLDDDLPFILKSKEVYLVMDVEADIDARIFGNQYSEGWENNFNVGSSDWIYHFADWEKEILLDKNQTFDITDVTQKNGKLYIYMKHRTK